MAPSRRFAVCLVFLPFAALALAAAEFRRTLTHDDRPESWDQDHFPLEPGGLEASVANPAEPEEADTEAPQIASRATPEVPEVSDPPAGQRETAERRRQEDKFLAEKLYLRGKDRLHAGEFQSALEDLEVARDLDPESTKIRDLNYEVSRIIHRVPGEWDGGGAWISSQTCVRIEQARLDSENHMQAGNRAWYASDYGCAEKEFEAAISKLRWLTLLDSGMQDSLALARSRAEACRSLLPRGLGVADYSDGTAVVGIVDAETALNPVGETGIFTREHLGGAGEFYDIRVRSTFPATEPLVTDIPEFPVGKRGMARDKGLNQGVSYAAPDEPVMEFRPAESSLNQGLTYAPPPEQ